MTFIVGNMSKNNRFLGELALVLVWLSVTFLPTTFIRANTFEEIMENDMSDFLQIDQLNESLLFDLSMTAETNIDGSGETTETTAEMTSIVTSTIRQSTSASLTTSTSKPLQFLSQISQFAVQVACSQANETIAQILTKWKEEFPFNNNISSNLSTLSCPRSSLVDVPITIITNNSISVLNRVVQVLKSITAELNVTLKMINRCENGETILITEVNACYLIDLCDLCGTNPPRGICLPTKNVTRCECFVNTEDPSQIYTGDFCLPQRIETTQALSTPWNWSIIVIGILLGFLAVLISTISCLLLMVYRRRRRESNQNRSTAVPESEAEVPDNNQESIEPDTTPIQYSQNSQPPSEPAAQTYSTMPPTITTNAPEIYELDMLIFQPTEEDPIYELDQFFDDAPDFLEK